MAVKGINGADLNNISKVDGRSNVLDKVNGIDADLAPPAVAYSVRNVSGLTGIPYDGPAMRILVDATGDGADATDLEFDINFTADGDLDVADIELKCAGGKDAYVVKWYDQSGAGNDATQTTYADMSKICDAGTVVTENGKPACKGGKFTVSASSQVAQPLTVTTVSNRYGLDNALHALFRSTDVTFIFGHRFGGYTWRAPDFVQNLSVSNSGQESLVAIFDGSSSTLHKNSAAITMGDPGDGNLGVTQTVGSGDYFLYQELVVWPSDESTNRPTIENNINSYFNIYQSRENILPGAAAAYSLRQLSDSSRLAIRVRRDTGVGSGTDDDEADVGFDANGELSLASPVSNFDPTGSAATTLGEFLADAAYDDEDSLGAPADGFVTAWYDQSANANNATQATPESQPKIYDSSTGLITENGKPALNYNNDVLIAATSATITSESVMIVATQSSSGRWNRIVSQNATGTNDASSYIPCLRQDTTTNLGGFDGSLRSTVSFTYDQQFLFEAYNTGSALTNYLDSVAGTASSYSLNETIDELRLGSGRGVGGNEYLIGKLQEVIVYHSDQSSNRSDIETNINTYFSIYT